MPSFEFQIKISDPQAFMGGLIFAIVRMRTLEMFEVIKRRAAAKGFGLGDYEADSIGRMAEVIVNDLGSTFASVGDFDANRAEFVRSAFEMLSVWCKNPPPEFFVKSAF